MIVVWLFIITGTLADGGNCIRNHTILETSGDAILTVFVDIYHGESCNETSSKGFQELTTALYVTSTLNKNDYIPGISLGLKIIDTCRDSATVARESLIIATECPEVYSLGILVPFHYHGVLEPISSYTDLSITFYGSQIIPSINMGLDFITRNFHTIDLLLTDSTSTSEIFLNQSQFLDVCIKSYDDISRVEDDQEATIVILGDEFFIRSWLEVERINVIKTWIIIPLDDSDVTDIVPLGSYVLMPEARVLHPADSDSSADEIKIPVPMIFSLGSPLIGIADLFSSLQVSNCTEACVLPSFDSKLVPEVPGSRVIEALNLDLESNSMKWGFYQRLDPADQLQQVLEYQVAVDSFKIRPGKNRPRVKVPKNGTHFCEDQSQLCECINKKKSQPFPKTTEAPDESHYQVFILIDPWAIIFLIFVAFGALICLCICGFILYRFIIDEFMDGNPLLTFILIIGTISMLMSVVIFCLSDNTADHEYLNSFKILAATISMGFVLSIMLARTFFLAFSTKGVFSSHINGYLQTVMAFFINAVQVAVSGVFFLVNRKNSQEVLSSYQFIALSSYNIFLLVTLLVMCALVYTIPRNYREGRCFLFTSLGLLGVWIIWISTFFLVPPSWRETIIAIALITTSYTLISGLILKVFYILTHIERQNDIRSPFENSEFRSEPRRRSFRQSRRPFHDYVLPMEGVRNQARLQTQQNFYGNSSPGNRSVSDNVGNNYGHGQNGHGHGHDGHGNVKTIGFNNYGYSDMHETENHYVVPKVCIQNPVSRKKVDVNYAQPVYDVHNYHESLQKNNHQYDNDNNEECMETEIYLEGKRLSPTRRGRNESYPSRSSSPRLHQTEATIDEEDETNEEVAKITHF
ncbi:protein bride of sevenless [Microplitis mediator]|uniref:protein bride of sevenless n=1 Tax=Microplitis mediator TaxID=375433 RepID=UPI002553091C|nr:protein bride of sevenless [Microplitis mediator]